MSSPRQPGQRQLLIAIVICTAVSAIAGLLWDRWALDLYTSLILPKTDRTYPDPDLTRGVPESRVVIVDVSDPASRGLRIVDRATLARVIAKVSDLGAWAIGLDVVFDRPLDPVADRALRTAIDRSGRVVMASFYRRNATVDTLSPFSSAASALGMANLVVDPDGRIRRIQHYYVEPGFSTRHSLSLAVVSVVVSYPSTRPAAIEVRDDGLLLKSRGGGSIDVPVDDRGLSLIQYRGGPGTIPVLNWKRVLEADGAKVSLAGKGVLVGNAQHDVADSFVPPFHPGETSLMTGVEIHAQNALGMLAGSRRRTASRTSLVATCLAAVLFGVVLVRLRLVWLMAFGGLGLGMVWTIGYLVFARADLFLNPMGASIAFLAATATSILQSRFRTARLVRGEQLETRGRPEARAIVDAATERTIDRGLEFLSDGHADRAVTIFQETLSSCSAQVSPRLRWALALALTRQNELDLAAEHLSRLDGEEISLPDLYTLGRDLEAHGALPEAVAIYRQIRSREMAFLDVDQRLPILESRDCEVPERLRRSLSRRYTDLALIGGGGMGRVYRARDVQLEMDVALKVPFDESMALPDLRRRFARETRALARLSHPNIVKLLDLSLEQPIYYTMELVEGITLKDLFRNEGRIDPSRALALMRPIASALAAAHCAGIIHRDVKPENILLDPRGVPLLTDFGLAHLEGTTRITQTSMGMGTPAYMAPEQRSGYEPSCAVDVFSFGAVLFEALTGSVIVAVQPLSRLPEFVCKEPYDRTPELDEKVETLIVDCLAIDPTLRPQDGKSLLERIDPLVSL